MIEFEFERFGVAILSDECRVYGIEKRVVHIYDSPVLPQYS